MRIFIAFVLLFAIAGSISIPVSSQSDKCMIVYTQTGDDFLKVDLKFSKFTGQTD
jgi:hypothetical protein